MRSRSLGLLALLALLGVLAACQPVTPPPPPGPLTLGWNQPGITGPIAADATHGWLWAMDRSHNVLDAVQATTGTIMRQYSVPLDGSQHFPTPFVTADGSSVVIESGNKVVDINPNLPTPVWTSPALDGIVQSRPLVVGSVVVVATEDDSLYGLSLSTGQFVWTTTDATTSDHGQTIGTPESQAHNNSLPGVNGCGDIWPLGITSNLVLASNDVYAVGEVQTGTTPGADPPDFQMMAVNPATGAVAVAPTSIAPASMKTLPVQIWAEQQRAGLVLNPTTNNIYVGFGGLAGDCGKYHGYDVVVDQTGVVKGDLEVAATTNAGAIWSTAGAAVDSAGTVYVSTGNNTDGNPATGTDYTDGVIAVPPTINSEVTAPPNYFQPAEWQSDNNADLDLGSSAPVLLANGTQLFEIGKQHNAFLLNTSALGGGDHETPVFRLNGVCSGVSDGQNATLGNSAYFNCSSSGMWQVVIS